MSKSRYPRLMLMLCSIIVAPFAYSACESELSASMATESPNHRLSSKLSPQAKKLVLSGAKGKMVDGLLMVTTVVELSTLKEKLGGLNIQINSVNEKTRQLNISVPVDQLEPLVSQEGVIYFEAATTYSQ